VNLLNEGAVISLCNDRFVIKKDENSEEWDALTMANNINVESFVLHSFILNIPEDDEENGRVVKEFIDELKEILDFNGALISAKEKLEEKMHENAVKKAKGELTDADILELNFLELEASPFYRSYRNKYLQYMLPGIEEYIEKEYWSYDVYTLLFKCDCCGDIYDIVDFIDLKKDKSVLELLESLNNIDIEDINICKYCYDPKYSASQGAFKDRFKSIIEKKYS
jgi:hypothetical protein